VTPAEVALVQASFRRIVPMAEQAGALFYARLFELDPALRSLFSGEMQDQGRKLMSTLARAVAALEETDTLLSAVRALGARHHGYGVLEEHYASVGAALIWTLKKGLGPEFTPAVASAWTNIYSHLATTMIEAQRSARAAA
jgi:hemoglobin-like flavoprotein